MKLWDLMKLKQTVRHFKSKLLQVKPHEYTFSILTNHSKPFRKKQPNQKHTKLMSCSPYTCVYTAISINVVGSKQKAIRQDRKVIWEFFIINSSKSAMPRPFSEDLRWRTIWMKKNVRISSGWGGSCLKDATKNYRRLFLKSFKFLRSETKHHWKTDKQCGHAPGRGIFDYESSAFKSTPKRHYVT